MVILSEHKIVPSQYHKIALDGLDHSAVEGMKNQIIPKKIYVVVKSQQQ